MNYGENMMKKLGLWLFMITLACMILSGCIVEKTEEEKTVEENTSKYDQSGNLVEIEGKGK